MLSKGGRLAACCMQFTGFGTLFSQLIMMGIVRDGPKQKEPFGVGQLNLSVELALDVGQLLAATYNVV